MTRLLSPFGMRLGQAAVGAMMIAALLCVSMVISAGRGPVPASRLAEMSWELGVLGDKQVISIEFLNDGEVPLYTELLQS